MELQSALFFTESSSLLRLPTHVISNVSIDEEGHIWMAIPKPAQRIEEFETEIPAKLDFFKKHKRPEGGDDDFQVRVGVHLVVEQRLAEAAVALLDAVMG